MQKKTVFLTGATGNMGAAGLSELLKQKDKFNIVLLARYSNSDEKKLAHVINDPSVRIVWGDLLNYNDVLNGITGADYVLHVGGAVSPAADYYPSLTLKTNVTAAENIVKAVLEQPNKDDMKVVYIGTVAQTSDRNEPIHWGRTGDPICISVYDHYAASKAQAEKIFVESGIKNWVCLRQSGILYPDLLKKMDPIMFHVPLRGVLEWATVEDSGRLLANVCQEDVPASFWNNFYNIGSGDAYRLSNYEFEKYLLKAISCPKVEKMFDPHWFVLRNFHGQWYQDSDKLNDILKFRENLSLNDYFKRLSKQAPFYTKLSVLCPAFIIKWGMSFLANKKRWGTQSWIKNNEQVRISAFYGSMDAYNAIPRSWAETNTVPPSKTDIVTIDHGYDESKDRSEWTIEDMQQAAEFRGGNCVSQTMIKGDYSTPLIWESHDGERFMASPALILLGGHWAPSWTPNPESMKWRYNELAKHSPFFSQVWTPLHGTDETEEYDYSIFDGWE